MFRSLLRRGLSTTPPARKTVGVRRENKGVWERRVALTPDAVAALVKEGHSVVVQPCSRRIFSNSSYERVGATIADDLSGADVIVGVKEVPTDDLLPQKTYIFFSHTHKGQSYNMPMLKDVLDKRINLVDYELMTNDHGKRLVMFGQYAGMAGFVDGLHGLGQRFLQQGQGTPFIHLGMSHTYRSTDHAKQALRTIGDIIDTDGLPTDPLLFTFTGTGNVATGAQDMFRCLPHEYVQVADLPDVVKSGSTRRVYAVEAKLSDYIVRKGTGEPLADVRHYYEHPGDYESVFHERIAPYTSMLTTGHYWEPKYPRLISQAQAAAATGRLITLADVSCDINGGIEFMDRASTLDAPFFYYDPAARAYHDNPRRPGVQIMSVDHLPCEFPMEASNHFANNLLPHLSQLLAGGITASPVIQRATIARDGRLAARHAWLSERVGSAAGGGRKRVLILGSGYVSKPAVDYLLQFPDTTVTIASNQQAEAAKISGGRPRTAVADLDVKNPAALQALVRGQDAVISFVPAAFHPQVAAACLAEGVDMVTASYLSPAMKALDQAAKDRGVMILNEMGLDPGIDHLTAKAIIDETHAAGGTVEKFVSWCGGLPAPENADNALGYKFSWSPRGVLLAATNPAEFRWDGHTENVAGPDLLKAAKVVDLSKGFALEGTPNRDSLSYMELYGLDPAHLQTMFRGTLRFRGYSALLDAFKTLGLLSTAAPVDAATWPAFWADLLGLDATTDLAAVTAALQRRLGGPADQARRVADALQEWGMLAGARPIANRESPLDALCSVLEKEMVYRPGERDLVLMHHIFQIRGRDGQRSELTSTLVAYGEPIGSGGYSAMAKTVGLPAAIATRLMVEGKIRREGVSAPMTKDVYEPVMAELTRQKIVFVERERKLAV